MNLQSKRWAAVAAILSGSVLFAAASAGQTRPLEQARPQTANRMRIGAVTIAWGHGQIISKKNAGITLDLTGGRNGAKNVEMTSQQFDMAAPHVAVDIRKGVVYTGTATGGVRIEVRQEVIVDKKPMRRVTTLNGDNATYYAAEPGNPDKPRRIIVRGDVHGVGRWPEFSLTDPLDIVADSVIIKFLDAETITIDLDNAKGSGTPVEREPKAKP